MFGLFKKWGQKPETIKDEQSTTKLSDHKKSVQHKLKRSYAYRVELEMTKLKTAILSAENYTQPNRQMLYAIYKEVLRDSTVLTQLRSLRHKITSADLILYNASGQEDEAKQLELFDAPWLIKYMSLFVDTYFWGHSLVELFIDKGEISMPWLVPRDHVHPWSGYVVANPTDIKGLPFREKPLNSQLIEIGESDDLGLLLVIAREVIWKNYARTDWSRYSEKFGMPQVVIKAAGANENELDAKEKYAREFGSNGYMILDDEDEIDLLENGKTDAYKVYLEQIKLCSEEISKIIVGQTATSQNQAWTGTAEVQERTLDTYVWAILRSLQYHINRVLIPFLTANGLPLDGYKIKFPELETKASATPGQEKTGEKKKLNLSVQLPWLADKKTCCEHNVVELADKTLLNLDKITAAAIDKIYKKKLKKGDLDEDLWQFNVKEILKAIEKGTGISYASLKYGDKNYELLTSLRKNVYVFAAFKNHKNIADMVEALTDEQGEIRSFDAFKEMANSISKVYNEDWLKAEYNTGISQAQMALKWNDLAEQAKLFPWIQYVAVQDDRTRSAHAELHGVTLKWDDPFWLEFFPPNGWNCRCTIKTYATATEVKPESLPSLTETPAAFRHNPGVDGELYSQEHPYYDNVTADEKADILKAIKKFNK